MADKKFEKLPVHQSPRGTAIFPYLNTADTKWKPEGEYKTKLAMDDGSALREIVDEQMKAAEVEAKEKARAATKKTGKKVEAKAADLPYYDEVDDEGDETGRTIASFKSTASGVSQKTGKPWKRQIPLFDARGNAMRKDVFGGSILIVAYSAKPWVNPKCEFGVKLQIEAVQVIELVSTGGAAKKSASGFGFGAQEGYEDDGEEPTSGRSDDAEDQTSGSDSSDDSDDQF